MTNGTGLSVLARKLISLPDVAESVGLQLLTQRVSARGRTGWPPGVWLLAPRSVPGPPISLLSDLDQHCHVLFFGADEVLVIVECHHWLHCFISCDCLHQQYLCLKGALEQWRIMSRKVDTMGRRTQKAGAQTDKNLNSTRRQTVRPTIRSN